MAPSFDKSFPPVRLDAPRSIQPDFHIHKTRVYALLRLLAHPLVIWKWVANPMPCLHCHKWHADWSLDCNRTDGNFFICNGSARDFALAKSARTCKYKERVG